MHESCFAVLCAFCRYTDSLHAGNEYHVQTTTMTDLMLDCRCQAPSPWHLPCRRYAGSGVGMSSGSSFVFRPQGRLATDAQLASLLAIVTDAESTCPELRATPTQIAKHTVAWQRRIPSLTARPMTLATPYVMAAPRQAAADASHAAHSRRARIVGKGVGIIQATRARGGWLERASATAWHFCIGFRARGSYFAPRQHGPCRRTTTDYRAGSLR